MKKNGQDDLIRKLEQRVLSGDLSAVPQLAKLYARAGRYGEAEQEPDEIYTLVIQNNENAGDVFVNSFTTYDKASDFADAMILEAAERLIRNPDADDVFNMDVTDAEIVLERKDDPMAAYNDEVSFDSGLHFAIVPSPFNPKFEPKKPQAGDTELMPRHFTRAELEAMPTLGMSQVDSRKYDQDGWRVWLSRGTLADGETMAGRVTVEHIVDGVWRQWEEYDVGPPEPDEDEEPETPPPPRRRRRAPKG